MPLCHYAIMPFKNDIVNRLIASDISTSLVHTRKLIANGRFGDVGYNDAGNIAPTIDRAIEVLEAIHEERVRKYSEDHSETVDEKEYLDFVRDVRTRFNDNGVLIQPKTKAKTRASAADRPEPI